jgi:YggT family protein
MGIFIALIDIVQFLLWILSIIIIVQAIMSWLVGFNVVNSRNGFVAAVWNALERITEPLYRPIRKIMPDFGGIDFSPLVVLLIIWVIQRLLGGVELDLERSLYMGV